MLRLSKAEWELRKEVRTQWRKLIHTHPIISNHVQCRWLAIPQFVEGYTHQNVVIPNIYTPLQLNLGYTPYTDSYAIF